jgi:hypothetical protein
MTKSDFSTKTHNLGNTLGNYSTKEKGQYFTENRCGRPRIFLPIPGPKMIWQFGELGFEYGINRCTDNTYNNACRLAEKTHQVGLSGRCFTLSSVHRLCNISRFEK